MAKKDSERTAHERAVCYATDAFRMIMGMKPIHYEPKQIVAYVAKAALRVEADRENG